MYFIGSSFSGRSSLRQSRTAEIDTGRGLFSADVGRRPRRATRAYRPASAVGRVRGGLVGREPEMATLTECPAAALRGPPGGVVPGRAGHRQTRLMTDELVGGAEAQVCCGRRGAAP